MKKYALLNLLLAAGSLVSCNSDALLEPEISEYSIVQGDTVKTRTDKNKNFKGHPMYSRFIITGDSVITYKRVQISKPSQTINLKNIENPSRKGKPFRMVVFGGSVAAGVRDGGLFNEGMETSFGSLLANQMGVEFKNPLFDSDDYNGFGRIEPTTYNPTGGPIPKFKQVANNTAIDATQKEENGDVVLKKTRVQYDNYAFPYGSTISQGETVSYITGKYGSIPPLVKRLNNPNLSEEIKQGRTFDFFVLEIPEMDESILSYGAQSSPEEVREYLDNLPEFDNLNPPNLGPGAVPSASFYYNNFFKKMERIGAKGVILNLPDLYSLPFYKSNYKSNIDNLLNTYKVYSLNIFNKPYFIPEKTVLESHFYDWNGGSSYSNVVSGYSSLDSLISPNVNISSKPGIGKNPPVTLTLLSKDFIDSRKKERNVSIANFQVIERALRYPIVDLFKLYETISNGAYVTHDGIKVNGRWPAGGNFFSADGINPSAFGQAVITNEIIKVINSHYKTNIELISTRQFLQK